MKVYTKMKNFGSIYKNGKKWWCWNWKQSPIWIKNIDINKTAVSNKDSFSKKCFINFIGYKDVKKVRPLYVLLPKMTAYRRYFYEIFLDKRWWITRKI